MSPAVVVLLFVCAFGIRLLSAADKIVVIPNLSLKRSYIANDTSSAVSNVIPGPSGTAARFAVLHSWGVSVLDFTRSTFLTGLLSNVAMIAFPGCRVPDPRAHGRRRPQREVGDRDRHDRRDRHRHHRASSCGRSCAARSSRERSAHLAAAGEAVLPDAAPTSAVDLGRARGHPAHRHGRDSSRPRGSCSSRSCSGPTGSTVCCSSSACGPAESPTQRSTSSPVWRSTRSVGCRPSSRSRRAAWESSRSPTQRRTSGRWATSYHTEIVAAVLVYRALTYLLPIITGAFCYGIWRWMLRKERHAAAVAVTAQA